MVYSKGSAREISLQTELAPVADVYATLVPDVCQVSAPTRDTLRRRTTLHTVSFPNPAQREAVLETFGHAKNEISVRLNRANLDCEDCARAYLRGAFMVCGAVSNPEHDYHLEFSVPYYNLSRNLLALLREMNFPAKSVSRNGSYVIYLKESEQSVTNGSGFFGTNMDYLYTGDRMRHMVMENRSCFVII